jgi:hypothetical protein
MWEHHRFLGTEIFSHTMAGVRWLNFEALGQILLYAAERAAGLEGVRALWVFLSLLSLGLLVRSARAAGAAGRWLVPLAGLAFLLLDLRLKPRPEIFSWACFSALVLIVESARAGASPAWEKRFPWAVAGLFLFWVNTHPGYIYGLLYLTALAAGARWAGDRRSFIARLDRAIVLAFICVPLTPLGFNVAALHLETVFEVRRGIPIAEWRPTAVRDAPLFWASFLIAGAALARGILRRDPGDRRWAAAILGFGILGTSVLRNSVLIVFPLIPWLAAKFAAWERAKPEVRRAGGIVAASAAGGLIFLAVVHPPPSYLLSRRNLPVEACRFVKSAGIEGTMYNSYGWGGYIGWALPDRKVFQDGRYLFAPFLWEEVELEVFGPDSDRRGLWAAYLDRYGVDYGIMDDKTSPALESFHPPLMSERLFPEDRWALVYWDDLSWVFVKRIPKFEPLIRAREYRALRPARQELLFAGTLPAPAAAIRAELERHAREVSFSLKGAFLEKSLQARSPRS